MFEKQITRFGYACALFLVIGNPVTALAQHSQPMVKTPPREATQYDFLVGQWDLTVTPKATSLAARIHGTPKLTGTWKGWHALDGWGVEDELRIVDASGNSVVYTHFVRMYDGAAKKWAVSSADVTTQYMAISSAVMQGNDLVSVSTSADSDGKLQMTRTRLSAITPNSFRFQQDHSDDGGKTWDEARLVIAAKRVSATASR